jgi:hypothetical protein
MSDSVTGTELYSLNSPKCHDASGTNARWLLEKRVGYNDVHGSEPVVFLHLILRRSRPACGLHEIMTGFARAGESSRGASTTKTPTRDHSDFRQLLSEYQFQLKELASWRQARLGVATVTCSC